MPNMSRNLTDQQKLFIEYFSQTGNATQSCIKAGYSKNTAEQQGYELKHKLAREIETATKKILSGSVPIAVDVLTKLVSDPKIPPSTRLQAVNLCFNSYPCCSAVFFEYPAFIQDCVALPV